MPHVNLEPELPYGTLINASTGLTLRGARSNRRLFSPRSSFSSEIGGNDQIFVKIRKCKTPRPLRNALKGILLPLNG